MDESEFLQESNPPSVTDDKLEEIVKLGAEMSSLIIQVRKIEQILEAKKKELETIQRFTLPEAMDAIGMSQFRLRTGETITVNNVFRLSYEKDKIDQIDHWLDQHGHTGLVKRRLIVTIPRGDKSNRVAAIAEAAKESGYEVVDEKNIHWQTLNKWGRECNEQGEVIPDDLFNVYTGREAKVT
jgi:hypothetical protein